MQVAVSTNVYTSDGFLTIWGSFERLTQPEISFRVSRFTVLILRIKGCFVTISPATQRLHSDTDASILSKVQPIRNLAAGDVNRPELKGRADDLVMPKGPLQRCISGAPTFQPQKALSSINFQS